MIEYIPSGLLLGEQPRRHPGCIKSLFDHQNAACCARLVVGRRRGWQDLAAIDLPADGRPGNAKSPGNLKPIELGLQQGLDRHPINLRHAPLVGSHFGDTLQVAPFRTSNLSSPSPCSCR